MAERLVKLTRVGSNPNGVPSIVNLDNVAWMESNEDGSTRVLFAVTLARFEHDSAAIADRRPRVVAGDRGSGRHRAEHSPKRPSPRRGQTRPLDATRMMQRTDDGHHPRAAPRTG